MNKYLKGILAVMGAVIILAFASEGIGAFSKSPTWVNGIWVEPINKEMGVLVRDDKVYMFGAGDGEDCYLNMTQRHVSDRTVVFTITRHEMEVPMFSLVQNKYGKVFMFGKYEPSKLEKLDDSDMEKQITENLSICTEEE